MFNKETIISLIDLTYLDDQGNDAQVEALCQKANNLVTPVASICIYPRAIQTARAQLNKEIAIATVINFPTGNLALDQVIAEAEFALMQGADEIDLVIPYQNYLKHAQADNQSIELVKAIKAVCQNKCLKVIIESGELKSPQLIRQASIDAIDGGADFIKTSTGKVAIGATLDAASIMLDVIKDCKAYEVVCGFKASGGIRCEEDAISYLELAEEKLGKGFIHPKTFRFGASSLLDDLVK
ncbi:deoxyribose-phosphate aldolase [Thiotrichales bacterium 19S3-7]|nr:deoxyribose-phosphate aldolase [Thiotrichales bacterium 19S3-7]MCF6800598.1 deoxyribose-phosphate aldolase [Thiotrichales bacterium 19S3-11]